jgi:hypothetical protein
LWRNLTIAEISTPVTHPSAVASVPSAYHPTERLHRLRAAAVLTILGALTLGLLWCLFIPLAPFQPAGLNGVVFQLLHTRRTSWNGLEAQAPPGYSLHSTPSRLVIIEAKYPWQWPHPRRFGAAGLRVTPDTGWHRATHADKCAKADYCTAQPSADGAFTCYVRTQPPQIMGADTSTAVTGGTCIGTRTKVEAVFAEPEPSAAALQRAVEAALSAQPAS